MRVVLRFQAIKAQTASGSLLPHWCGNGGGNGSPSAMSCGDSFVSHAGGFGGYGGGNGSPSATILCRFIDIDPATAARPTTSRVTTSKRFMFFSKLLI